MTRFSDIGYGVCTSLTPDLSAHFSDEPVLVEEIPKEAEEICPWRKRHLAKESRWMKCDMCRQQLAAYARQLSKTMWAEM